jgi:hypothetical protein
MGQVSDGDSDPAHTGQLLAFSNSRLRALVVQRRVQALPNPSEMALLEVAVSFGPILGLQPLAQSKRLPKGVNRGLIYKVIGIIC